MAARTFNDSGNRIGHIDSDLRITHATASTVEYIMYNDTNKSVIVHINTGAGMVLTFPAYSDNPHSIEEHPAATQREYTLSAGESVQFRGVSTGDNRNFNVDSVFTRVRHSTPSTERHVRALRGSGQNLPGRLIVTPVDVSTS